MAILTHYASPVPSALPNTTPGTEYQVQNQGEDLLFATTATAAPTDPHADATPKAIIPSYSQSEAGIVPLTPAAGTPPERIWVWARAGGPGVRVGYWE